MKSEIVLSLQELQFNYCIPKQPIRSVDRNRMIQMDLDFSLHVVSVKTLTTAVYKVPVVPTMTKVLQVGIPVAETLKHKILCLQRKENKQV